MLLSFVFGGRWGVALVAVLWMLMYLFVEKLTTLWVVWGCVVAS